MGISHRHPLGKHAHGGVGLTSTEVLEKIGGVAHPKVGWNKEKIIAEGEIAFSRDILKAAYELIPYPLLDWNDKIYPYGTIKG